MTASGPVGQMSKSTTELPAGRLNSEVDAGEGNTLSSPETNGEGSVANADKATTGRVRNIANARLCAWVIKASSDWTQAILEHAAPNSGESRISKSSSIACEAACRATRPLAVDFELSAGVPAFSFAKSFPASETHSARVAGNPSVTS